VDHNLSADNYANSFRQIVRKLQPGEHIPPRPSLFEILASAASASAATGSRSALPEADCQAEDDEDDDWDLPN
jgi:hypothetical protein